MLSALENSLCNFVESLALARMNVSQNRAFVDVDPAAYWANEELFDNRMKEAIAASVETFKAENCFADADLEATSVETFKAEKCFADADLEATSVETFKAENCFADADLDFERGVRRRYANLFAELVDEFGKYSSEEQVIAASSYIDAMAEVGVLFVRRDGTSAEYEANRAFHEYLHKMTDFAETGMHEFAADSMLELCKTLSGEEV